MNRQHDKVGGMDNMYKKLRLQLRSAIAKLGDLPVSAPPKRKRYVLGDVCWVPAGDNNSRRSTFVGSDEVQRGKGDAGQVSDSGEKESGPGNNFR